MLNADGLNVGQMVCSTLGRDKGKVYVVIGLAEKNRLLLADGRTRKIENPKKKNIKHLRKLSVNCTEGTKKALKPKFTNSDIVKCIDKYRCVIGEVFDGGRVREVVID